MSDPIVATPIATNFYKDKVLFHTSQPVKLGEITTEFVLVSMAEDETRMFPAACDGTVLAAPLELDGTLSGSGHK